MHEEARNLLYVDFPTKWVWNNRRQKWQMRQKGKSVGRIIYIHSVSRELYFLRMLLNNVRGPWTYKEIRIVEGVTHPTFQSACHAI